MVANRAAAYEMAAEMATWPEPIDVIRHVCGLPPRLPILVGRAWHDFLASLVDAPRFLPGATATDAEAARMARLMLASTGWTEGRPVSGARSRKAHRR